MTVAELKDAEEQLKNVPADEDPFEIYTRAAAPQRMKRKESRTTSLPH
jgi:hypothetical protein